MEDALLYASASAIAQAIREQQVSVKDVVEAHLERIAVVNPSLNAVVQLVAERALDEVHIADQSMLRGGAGLLPKVCRSACKSSRGPGVRMSPWPWPST
jgi:Asp-tRNA(Asn)/Glu-tRNA(Gln) amidotransferase A subunit family amidase